MANIKNVMLLWVRGEKDILIGQVTSVAYAKGTFDPVSENDVVVEAPMKLVPMQDRDGKIQYSVLPGPFAQGSLQLERKDVLGFLTTTEAGLKGLAGSYSDALMTFRAEASGIKLA